MLFVFQFDPILLSIFFLSPFSFLSLIPISSPISVSLFPTSSSLSISFFFLQFIPALLLPLDLSPFSLLLLFSIFLLLSIFSAILILCYLQLFIFSPFHLSFHSPSFSLSLSSQCLATIIPVFLYLDLKYRYFLMVLFDRLIE
jgi:hypothetical protein